MSLMSPQLEAFIAITKHKTVRSAATTLNITQTAATQRIQSLEEKLSTTLFIRSRKGMILTPEGEALLRYCNAAYELEGEALAKIKGSGIESDISVCITGPSSIMRSRIIKQCFNVLKKFPKLLIQFDINDNKNRISTLRSGDSQIAIIEEEETNSEMETKTLKPENMVLVCSSKWKNRSLKDIINSERIIDYDPNDQMTYNYLKHYNLYSSATHERHFANRTDALALMIINGFGFGVLTEEYSKPYVDEKQLIILNEGNVYQNKLAMAWFTRHQPPKYFQALINAIT